MGIAAAIVIIKIAVVDQHVAMILVMLEIDIAKEGLMMLEIDFADVLHAFVIPSRERATLIADLVKDALEDVLQIDTLEINDFGVAGGIYLKALIISRFPVENRKNRCMGDAGDTERQATDAKTK